MTTTLSELLNSDAKRQAVIDDCLHLLDDEVADKKGMSGMAIKAGYKTVKNVRPGFLRGAVEDLLPDFTKAVEPIYQEALTKNENIAHYMSDNSGRVADALLAITDGKAERAKTMVVKRTYDKLRGSAKHHVEAAVPRLGKLVEKHAQ
jgi:DNA-binding phage protein